MTKHTCAYLFLIMRMLKYLSNSYLKNLFKKYIITSLKFSILYTFTRVCKLN